MIDSKESCQRYVDKRSCDWKAKKRSENENETDALFLSSLSSTYVHGDGTIKSTIQTIEIELFQTIHSLDKNKMINQIWKTVSRIALTVNHLQNIGSNTLY